MRRHKSNFYRSGKVPLTHLLLLVRHLLLLAWHLLLLFKMHVRINWQFSKQRNADRGTPICACVCVYPLESEGSVRICFHFCFTAGGHSTHHQGVANEEPGGVVLKRTCPIFNGLVIAGTFA